MGCKRIISSAAIWLLCLGLVFVPSRALADSPEDVALRHVQAFDLGSNLIPHGLRIAQLTHTYGMIAAEIGIEAARNLVEEELSRAAPSVRDEWDLIVARSYLDHFSPEELESITREGRRSPFAGKLVSERGNVQVSLNSRGKEFFTMFVGKAVSRAFEKSLAKP